MDAENSRSFLDDNAAFEGWLRRQCEVDESDLAYKHERMDESAFVFLRATFFRWARIIKAACPGAAETKRVLAVGDIHVENYGVWRDRDGRLAWGVNDFDEAARMPYGFDLTRLAVSAFLSPDIQLPRDDVVAALLEGYEAGLQRPAPVVLDRDHVWLRPLVTCSEKARAKFWAELDAGEAIAPPKRPRRALEADLPRRAQNVRFIARRRKGGGGLGKPRYALIADWRGGAWVREAKAATPSAWDWAQGKRSPRSRAIKLALGETRAPDPFFAKRDGFFVRRIGPDSRKIEFDDEVKPMMRREILALMARDLGAIHATDARAALIEDAARRTPVWLRDNVAAALAAVDADYRAWLARPKPNASKA